jgi:hypothetical protein
MMLVTPAKLHFGAASAVLWHALRKHDQLRNGIGQRE